MRGDSLAINNSRSVLYEAGNVEQCGVVRREFCLKSRKKLGRNTEYCSRTRAQGEKNNTFVGIIIRDEEREWIDTLYS